MKVRILSDLHLEFAVLLPPSIDADVVVLAGDIGVGLDGLAWARNSFPGVPVIYVPGNHEYYGHDIELRSDLRRQSNDGLYVLDDEAIELQGVRFVGSTLWTDFALNGTADQSIAMMKAR